MGDAQNRSPLPMPAWLGGRGHTRALGVGACAAAILGLAVQGCGGSGGVTEPKPIQPISAVVPQVTKAIVDGSCGAFVPLEFSERRAILQPGAPPTSGECAGFQKELPALRDLTFTKGATYGTGGLLEGPITRQFARQHASQIPRGGHFASLAVVVLDRDGRYRWLFGVVEEPQIGTKPNAGAEDHGNAAQSVVNAVRSNDCGKLTPLIHPDNGLGGNLQIACRAVMRGHIFAPSLRATPDATPQLLGATRDFHFYGISTKATYFTMIMETPPGTSSKPPLLIDVVANTSNPGLSNSSSG